MKLTKEEWSFFMIKKINIKIIFLCFLFSILIYLHYYLFKKPQKNNVSEDNLVLATVTCAPPLAFGGHKDIQNSLLTTDSTYIFRF
ncbi:hypothetical protein [Candidatus Phytoplasma solani]|uniref:hypothetical protein n=1 Tax=Candidatus Phytoplasma solani TaxID=69896 RepID=UPI00358E311D